MVVWLRRTGKPLLSRLPTQALGDHQLSLKTTESCTATAPASPDPHASPISSGSEDQDQELDNATSGTSPCLQPSLGEPESKGVGSKTVVKAGKKRKIEEIASTGAGRFQNLKQPRRSSDQSVASSNVNRSTSRVGADSDDDGERLNSWAKAKRTVTYSSQTSNPSSAGLLRNKPPASASGSLGPARERTDNDKVASESPVKQQFRLLSSSRPQSPLGSNAESLVPPALDDDSDGDIPSPKSPSPERQIFRILAPKCPICDAVVSADLYTRFSKGKNISYDRAMALCASHQAEDASNAAKGREHVQIDWDNLDKRLNGYHDTLRAILEQTVESSYRADLQRTIESGRGRNALRKANSTTLKKSVIMGYYGARGAATMTEHIMAHFSEDIRSAAAKDALFAEVGVAGFVQQVLMPELLLLLVRDDHGGCDEATAKDILAQSVGLADSLMAPDPASKITAKASPSTRGTRGKTRRETEQEVIEIFSQESPK